MIASIDIISLQINSNLHERLKDKAKHDNTTVNELITEAIRECYIDKLTNMEDEDG